MSTNDTQWYLEDPEKLNLTIMDKQEAVRKYGHVMNGPCPCGKEHDFVDHTNDKRRK